MDSAPSDAILQNLRLTLIGPHGGVIATRLATFGGYECAHWRDEQARPCGLMDKAPDFGSGDCRFESCHGRVTTFWTQFCLDEKMSQTAFYELLLRME